MNRQAANYVESVGDPMPRTWQTPKHNFWCLVLTLSLLGIVFLLYYLQNSVKLDTIELNYTGDSQCLKKFEYHIDFGQKGEFERQADYGRKTTLDGSQYYGYRVFFTCKLDVEKYNQYLRAHQDDLSKVKDRYVYQQFNVNTKFHAHGVGIPSYHYILYTQEHPQKKTWDNLTGQFHQEVNVYTHKDTICYKNKISLFGSKNKVSECEYNIKSPRLSDVGIGRIRKYRFFSNIGITNVRFKKVVFPDIDKKEMILSFSSPMYFDIVSIQPDHRTDTQLFYESPEKIRQIENGDLYIFARSITTINHQETLNFLYATLIGIIISFCIEFMKRLYTAKKDEKFLMKQKAIYREGDKK